MILAPFTFNETEAEVAWFTAGWDARVLTGTGEHGCPDRNDHPGDRGLQGTQDQRISWQRGWDAADVVCHALSTNLEIQMIGGDREFVDATGMISLRKHLHQLVGPNRSPTYEIEVEVIVDPDLEGIRIVRRK